VSLVCVVKLLIQVPNARCLVAGACV